jgi:Tol biopolymer transport system component
MRIGEVIRGSILLGSISASSALAQSTELVSVSMNGAPSAGGAGHPSISADGRFVAFDSGAPDFVPGDTNGHTDIFVRDRLLGVTARVSVDSSGAQVFGDSRAPAISADGRFVAFTSAATTLVPNDTNGKIDVFVHDMQTGATSRVNVDSAGREANGNTPLGILLAISGDGRYVAFQSDATNLVPGDTNGSTDAFVHDLLTGQTVRASVDSNGNQAMFGALAPAISADGRWVAFTSYSRDLVAGDTNGFFDTFVHDMQTGATTLVSVSSNGTQGNDNSFGPRISADGRYVSFPSYASNLVPGDTPGSYDVFVHDRMSGLTTRASVGVTGAVGDGELDLHSFSADGRYVVFQSSATNLVPFDTNLAFDFFVRDLQTGQTTRASVTTEGAQAGGDTGPMFFPAISADGRYVAFQSAAANLVSADTHGLINIFVRDRGANPPIAFCFGDGTQATACPCSNSGSTWRGCQNSAATGGAVLTNAGVTSPDTLVLVSMAELPSALSIFLQGNADLAPGAVFGDGVRCVGGTLKRLYSKNAVGGVVSAPGPGDPSISARSAALGDPIAPGSTRSYQVYYRDPNLAFCAPPAGDSWNVSSANRVVW